MAKETHVKSLADAPKLGFWSRPHYLDRMTLRELVFAYFQHYTIVSYLVLAAASVAVFVWSPSGLLATFGAIVAAAVVYPLVWYSLHRWVLHGRWMYKLPMFAATWKRIHYDHHQDPNHLEVLFGALHTTLPTIAIATLPVGYAIGGIGGSAAAFAAGLLVTCYYEFIHCIQHLAFKPRSKIIARMKKLHMEHHFFDEAGNFGITNYLPDRLFGTYRERRARKDRSPTVFNLGYTEEVAKTYPWVADLSGGVASGHPRKRARG
jgi:sterol desaturase/sphingolipid hydroxylase (fatty acid hydroxylase superfamily)